MKEKWMSSYILSVQIFPGATALLLTILNKYNLLLYLQMSMTSLRFWQNNLSTAPRTTQQSIPFNTHHITYFHVFRASVDTFTSVSLFIASFNPYCCILRFLGRVGWFSWQQAMAVWEGVWTCCWLSRKVPTAGGSNATSVSPTFFKLYSPCILGLLLSIRFGSDKDAHVKTAVQISIWLLGIDYLLHPEDVRIPYFSSGPHPEFLPLNPSCF